MGETVREDSSSPENIIDTRTQASYDEASAWHCQCHLNLLIQLGLRSSLACEKSIGITCLLKERAMS